MTERNVLLENEIKANFILAKIMLLIFFIVILTVILAAEIRLLADPHGSRRITLSGRSDALQAL